MNKKDWSISLFALFVVAFLAFLAFLVGFVVADYIVGLWCLTGVARVFVYYVCIESLLIVFNAIT